MKKIYVILALIICSCSTAPKYLSFDNALETGIQKIGNDLPEGIEVAILDFKSDNENLSSYIIEEMYDKLVNFGKLSIMERSRTDTIALEVGYQLSGEVDDKEIIEIGKKLGADYVVTGQLTFSGEAYRLRIFAIEIKNGRRVASSSLNINRNDRQITYLLENRTGTTDDPNSLSGFWVNSESNADECNIVFLSGNNFIITIAGGGEMVQLKGKYDQLFFRVTEAITDVVEDAEEFKGHYGYKVIDGKLYILDLIVGYFIKNN
jgi:TolB-like protein